MLSYAPRLVTLERATSSYAAEHAARMGEELLAQHNFADAEAAFRIAVKADPDNPLLAMGIAEVFLVADDRAAARHWYGRAVELCPGLACAHNGVGVAADSLDAAEAAFRMALEFDPGNPTYRANLAWALYHLGVRVEAVSMFMQLAQENPEDLVFARALASILEEDGHVREAEYCLRAALCAIEDKPDIDEQAWYMYRLRAFDQAEKLFRRTFAWDCDLAAVFATHGRLALAVGEGDVAVVSLKRAVALSPRCERFHRDLAEALERHGDTFLADAARTRAKQMRRRRRRSTAELAVWAESAAMRGQP